MPIREDSDYTPPFHLFNGHVQTVVANIFRHLPPPVYERERIDTPDGDFLDLDWSFAGGGAGRLAIVAHGLEGHSRRPYIVGMVRALNRRGWDVVAWNFRGCGGETNRIERSYHAGDTDDLQVVVNHVCRIREDRALALVGFSLGGNLILKYLGEETVTRPSRLSGAAVFSVPCDLRDGALQLSRRANRLYLRRFLRELRRKLVHKAQRFPQLAPERLAGIRDFRGFDDAYTAPLHGFADAEDYWARCSARPFLRGVGIPTLLINARNDPFLGEPCYPWTEAADSSWLELEVPDHGGHVGFPLWGEEFWSERRAGDFLDEVDGRAAPTRPGGP